MTHFVCLVAGILEQLDKFDENLKVEPYVANCNRKKDIAKWQAILKSKDDKNYNLKNVAETIKRYEAMTDKQYYKYCGYKMFNSEGKPLTTYNPDSKYDWNVVGGRWDGYLKLKDNNNIITNVNCASKKAIDFKKTFKKYLPTALLVNGKWYAEGDVGWFGSIANQKAKKEWAKEIKEILAKIPDNKTITAVDCHI